MRDQDPGIPLSHYRSHRGCGVHFICLTCSRQIAAPLEAVISRLERKGLGDASTGIKVPGQLSRRPCSCGSVRWESRPAFAAIPDQMGGIPRS